MGVREGYKQTELGVIPEDWEVKRLFALCSMKSGEGITSSDIDEYLPFPCYGGNGLRGYAKRYTHEGKYALIGRQGALCGNVLNVGGKFFASEHAIVITAFPQTDIHWLTFVLSGMNLNQYSESSAQPGLSVSKLSDLPLACPPTKAEQEAIAEALSGVDALVESLEQLIAKKRQIKQGAMQELLTGKKRLPGFSGEWEVKKVKQFGEIVTGGTPLTGIKGFWNEDIPWVTPTDISDKKDIHTSKRQITALSLSSIRRLPSNSVLITCIASIGKNVVLRNEGACNQQINAIIPNKEHDADFMYYLIERKKQYLLGNAGITATLIISKRDFSELDFTVPLKAEQTAIATILSDMDAEISALESKLAKARQIKQAMMQDLLTGKIRLI